MEKWNSVLSEGTLERLNPRRQTIKSFGKKLFEESSLEAVSVLAGMVSVPRKSLAGGILQGWQ
jgi:hypothetical protein